MYKKAIKFVYWLCLLQPCNNCLLVPGVCFCSCWFFWIFHIDDYFISEERKFHFLLLHLYTFSFLFLFSLLMWLIALINFCMLNQSGIPGINPTWPWSIMVFIYCWIPFANICWEFLHRCLWDILICNFISYNGFSWFWY